MSGHGAPEAQKIDATGLKVVVVAGSWHDTITDGLIAGAQRSTSPVMLREAGRGCRVISLTISANQ